MPTILFVVALAFAALHLLVSLVVSRLRVEGFADLPKNSKYQISLARWGFFHEIWQIKTRGSCRFYRLSNYWAGVKKISSSDK